MVEYLSKMTVKELIEVGKRMQLVSPLSRMRKAELVKLISGMIEEYHSDALKMNESLTTFTLPGTDIVLTGKSARVMRHHMASVKRFNPTLKRDKDGLVILSAKQRRRVQKNTRRYAKGIGFYAIP